MIKLIALIAKIRFSIVATIITIAIFAAALNGCGFTLRSQYSLPPQLRGAYLQTEQPYGKIEFALKRSLEESGIILASNPLNAPIILQLSSTNFSYTSDTASTPSTQARVYHLTLSIDLSIHNAAGTFILEPTTVISRRDLILGINEIFASSTQVDRVKENMRRELLGKIFDILGSQKVRTAL
jgi:outer membrane lipopolysaccharide assembly protein LptE/RlpB